MQLTSEASQYYKNRHNSNENGPVTLERVQLTTGLTCCKLSTFPLDHASTPNGSFTLGVPFSAVSGENCRNFKGLKEESFEK